MIPGSLRCDGRDDSATAGFAQIGPVSRIHAKNERRLARTRLSMTNRFTGAKWHSIRFIQDTWVAVSGMRCSRGWQEKLDACTRNGQDTALALLDQLACASGKCKQEETRCGQTK